MVGPKAMAADEWVRATGGKEKNVHLGYRLRASGYGLGVRG